MHRVPEVIDCWFDSGSMPFAQHHYPFENKEVFERQFPADFISEAVDQTRGWFYTLLAISTLMFDKAPFKNCIVLGHVNDKNGIKMSKHKGNVVDPWSVLDKQGADAVTEVEELGEKVKVSSLYGDMEFAKEEVLLEKCLCCKGKEHKAADETIILHEMPETKNDRFSGVEKLEAMTCVCSVGLDMIAIPGDTKASTIAGIIADESAIGMVNQKTTAVRLIPVIGKGVGEVVEFGGLLGYAPIMPVNQFSCDAFVQRGGRIPAPIHSFKN